MAFTYRNVKGSALSWAELDENFNLVEQYHDESVNSAAIASAAANFLGEWASLTGAVTVPSSVRHSSKYWLLLDDVADVTTSEPGVSADWAEINVGNVQGPVSATDGHVALFDGATGKLLKSSGAGLVATAISNTPAGTIAATTVQAAINELDGEKVAKAGDTMTGALNLPSDGLNVGSGQLQVTGGGVNFGGAGNVLVTGSGGLGYGTGSGGTVTQATNKATGVTLNKPSGRITMNNAALAAGASVQFLLTNSSIASTDTVSVNPAGNSNYRAEAAAVASGNVTIRVTNTSGGSLSDALLLHFNVIKGATS